MAHKDKPVLLITMHHEKPSAVISDRSPIVLAFARGDS